MPPDARAQFEQTILEMIEQSPVGAVPGTPAHQDALRHLLALRQVYADADHKDGYVTVRSLAARPAFVAQNLEAFVTGGGEGTVLESENAIFDRYVAALPAEVRARAEAARGTVVGRLIHHRKHDGHIVRDPVRTLFLLPGAGPNPGLPGNYLYGVLREAGAAGESGWIIELHDRDDGAARTEAASLASAFTILQEVLASAPFHLSELEALGFRLV